MNRLTDPHGTCDGAVYQKLADKISSAMTRLLRQPENGGNPFLFAYAAPKPHMLMNELPGMGGFTTAATDGRKFFWNPNFLERLTYDDVVVVMMHEAYHTVFYHCDRLRGANQKVANIAFDYVVNAFIEVEFKASNSKIEYWGNRTKDSKSVLGTPWLFADLLAYIDGKQDAPPGNCLFADASLHRRSPESIYDEIMDHLQKSPRLCQTCGGLSQRQTTGKSSKTPSDTVGNDGCSSGNGCPDCGQELGLPGSMDQHIDTKASKSEVQQDVMRAAQQSKACRGNVPGAIEDFLGELFKPTLKFTDIIRSALLRKTNDEGTKNDWKRFRRRLLATKPRQYLPKRHGYKPRWLCMLDTSGSMSDKDMAFGLSQLQVLGNHTDGWIVPNDAQPHWEAATSIKRSTDVKRTKVIGRGGTVVSDFLKGFPAKMGTEWDAIIIITDGYIEQVDPALRPHCDVVWVITSDHKDFKPAFGRVAPLRNDRP